jgi:EAL domain-containing protein (putative c-di-GMP-specific phosphodiesterase class I)
MSHPVALGEQDLCITSSIGICLYPDDGATPEVLMKHADTAMYHAKSQGKDNFQFYADKMNIHATERLALERDLRAALNRGEFLMHYQPQVTLDDGKICGAEALLRWQHNDQMISPAEFIPAAEESGLIIPVGEWVLQTVCLQNKVWQTRGFPPLRVAVNLSTRQFRQKGLAELIGGLLQDIGLDPRCLELELTEGAAMQNPEEAAAILKALKKTGIHISIDDFGTGYSSLSYLKKFPLDTLKIDQSFVRDITTDPNDAAIVQAVIAMAHGLGLKVLAEGVETQEQAAFLHLHKCDMAQGYYFGRPMPAEAFYELITESTETKTLKNLEVA